MDKVLDDIGGFGRYQKIVLFVIGALSSLNAMAIFATVFTAAVPKLLCKYKQDNDSAYFNDTLRCEVWSNVTKAQQLNATSPYQCEWDTEFYGLTIINEWNLICDRTYLAGLTQTIFMVGALVSFPSGYFSDRYGRKTVCLIMSIVMSLSIILNETFQYEIFGLDNTYKYVIYVASQFCLGFTSYVLYVTSYVLLLEITSSKYNTIVSNVNLYLYVVGELIALVVAYLVRDWHIINWFLAAYSVIIVLMVAFILPESPRYLIGRKNFTKAYQILKRIAKTNGRLESMLSEHELKLLFQPNGKMSEASVEKNKLQDKEEDNNLLATDSLQSNTESQSLYSYLVNPVFNLIKTLLLTYIWVALSMIYYGVSLGITSISSDFDPYLMYFFSSIAEIVGYASCHLNDRFSRKKVLIGFLGSASAMCLVVALIPIDSNNKSLTVNSVLIMVFASIGKAAASAAFNSGYVFTTKQYPTTHRNTLVSLVSSIGRIGSLISPQVNMLRTILWAPLPYFVFSAISLVACLFTVFLPELSSLNYDL